jgi:hypothetical protein
LAEKTALNSRVGDASENPTHEDQLLYKLKEIGLSDKKAVLKKVLDTLGASLKNVIAVGCCSGKGFFLQALFIITGFTPSTTWKK